MLQFVAAHVCTMLRCCRWVLSSPVYRFTDWRTFTDFSVHFVQVQSKNVAHGTGLMGTTRADGSWGLTGSKLCSTNSSCRYKPNTAAVLHLHCRSACSARSSLVSLCNSLGSAITLFPSSQTSRSSSRIASPTAPTGSPPSRTCHPSGGISFPSAPIRVVFHCSVMERAGWWCRHE